MKRFLLITLGGIWAAAACGGSDDEGVFSTKDGADAGTGGSTHADSGSEPDSGLTSDSGGDVGDDCQSDDNCSGETRCDPLAGQCVACLFNHDCGDGARCEARRCVAAVTCENSLDCRDAPEQRQVCDEAMGECVECVGDADCGEGGECLDSICRPDPMCDDSSVCPGDRVCDSELGRCVMCSENGDCADGDACVDNECRTIHECTSDRECTQYSMLCDTEAGHCVQCRRHADCPSVYHCAGGACRPDVCESGQRACVDGGPAACNEAGDAFEEPEVCEAPEVCTQEGADASCGVADGGMTGGGSSDGGIAVDGGGDAGSCDTIFYRDKDRDGFGDPDQTQKGCEPPDGYVDNAGDCYDENLDAHPQQTDFFSTGRGDGSFDYDCDGSQERQYTEAGACSAFPTCSSTPGWVGDTPACGDPAASWLTSCAGLAALCAQNTEMRTQACR